MRNRTTAIFIPKSAKAVTIIVPEVAVNGVHALFVASAWGAAPRVMIGHEAFVIGLVGQACDWRRHKLPFLVGVGCAACPHVNFAAVLVLVRVQAHIG